MATALHASSAVTLREATFFDLPAVVDMGARFLASSVYATMLPSNPDQMWRTAASLVDGEHGVILIAETPDDRLVGMIGLLLFPHFMAGDLTAAEVFWWVEPEARGSLGVRLLKRAEQWATARGAVRLQMIAPSADVGQLYDRLGYTYLEAGYVKPLTLRTVDSTAADARERIGHGPSSPAWTGQPVTVDHVRVYDDVVPEPHRYRAQAMALSYGSVSVGAATFHGIASCDTRTLTHWITETDPSLRPTLTFFRQSPFQQAEPNFIHTDRDMGDWTAILYLNPDPPTTDGTTFWQHMTGTRASQATSDAQCLQEWQDWRDRSQWTAWHTVQARFNRLILFPAPLFHSRALLENYGQLGQDARLTQLVFGTGTACWKGDPCV